MEKEQYDAYNANSRSVALPNLPQSLKQHNHENLQVTREDLPVEGARAFVIHNFLLPLECQFFVDATEKISYEKHSDLAGEYPPEYRNNHRLISISHALADDIWGRLQPQLQFKDVHNITPLGFATEGLWLPSGINEAFLFSRYKPGQYFKPHYDGMYKNEHQDISIFTITIYLNDDFTGGSVKFLRSKEDPTAVYTYTPKKGDALIFNHDVYHEGEEVANNSKYIMRSCIMFRRVSNLVDPNKPWENDPLWQEMRSEFAKFNELRKENDPKKFTETFLRLQQIQLQHGRSIKNSLTSILPVEILVEIFGYLDLSAFGKVGQVCKAWHAVGIHGSLWRNLYEERWGSKTASYIEKTNDRADVVNWRGKYQMRHLVEKKGVDPLVIFTGEYLYAHKGKLVLEQVDHAKAERSYDPWDASFDGWISGYGYPYMVNYGMIGFNEHPVFPPLVGNAICDLKYSRLNAESVVDFKMPVILIVTNRLAWGDKKNVDFSVGSGEFDLEDLESETGADEHLKVAKSKHQLNNSIDSSITCVNEFNAFCVAYGLSAQYEPRTISFIDRSLCATISKNFTSALVICEEHEFSRMPAQLVVVPVLKFKVQRQFEKLIEVFYNTDGNDIEVSDKFIEVIREIVAACGGSATFDNKIILQYEALANKSFLRLYDTVISSKLKSIGFTVEVIETEEMLCGADEFAYSNDFNKSILFKNYQE